MIAMLRRSLWETKGEDEGNSLHTSVCSFVSENNNSTILNHRPFLPVTTPAIAVHNMKL